jgi:hypothetical protein
MVVHNRYSAIKASRRCGSEPCSTSQQHTDQSEPFQRFYENWMERRITAIKEDLS